MILRAILASPVGRRVIVLAAALVVAILITSYGQVILNDWNQPFYDALTRRDLNEFLYQLGVYFVIVACLLVLDVSQRWITETFKFRLREGLTRDLLKLWMAPRRAFWLATSGEQMGVNPDQRISEDADKLCNISADLSIGLFRASVLLVSFAGVLWTISDDFTFRVGGIDYAVPGFMLWAAISYAVVGSLLSYFVGRTLISAQRRPLRARGRPAVRARAHQRARRRHRARRRRSRRAPPRRNAHRQRRACHAPARSRPHQSHLGDGGIRLDHRHSADPDLGAAVFHRQDLVRRHDAGGRRVHSGAGLAALVRGQFRRDRGLARHAAARGELPSCAAGHRIARGGRAAASSMPTASPAPWHSKSSKSIRPWDASGSASNMSSSARASTC